MSKTLNKVERRVLGVLMEKALAQPSYYPMTINAIVVACNQKNNRDPFTELDEETVWNTLDALRGRGAVTRLLPPGGGRADRFKHECKTFFGWEAPQRAVMAELLLRGAQTVGELRTRCARMFAFDSVDAVSAVLDGLARLDPPQVGMLPRAPGQSAVRFTHLLYPPGEQPTLAKGDQSAETGERTHATAAPAGAPMSRGMVSAAQSQSRPALPEDSEALAALRSEVEALQSEVAELHEVLAELRRRFEALESQLR